MPKRLLLAGALALACASAARAQSYPQTVGPSGGLVPMAIPPAPSGLGAMIAVPAGSTNGTPIGAAPTGAVGVRFYLPSGASVTFTVAASQPTAAPTATFTISASSTGPNWDETLADGETIYVTAASGAFFRWY